MVAQRAFHHESGAESRSPLVANNGLSGHVAGTSALPPTADLRVSMSAFRPIPSASPPGADLPGGAAIGPQLTQTGHSRRWPLPELRLAKAVRFRRSSRPELRRLSPKRRQLRGVHQLVFDVRAYFPQWPVHNAQRHKLVGQRPQIIEITAELAGSRRDCRGELLQR